MNFAKYFMLAIFLFSFDMNAAAISSSSSSCSSAIANTYDMSNMRAKMATMERDISFLMALRSLKEKSESESHAGLSMLLIAAQNNDILMAEYLLDHGATIDDQALGHHRNTPLLVAASRGHLYMVLFLCMKGANIAYQNDRGETALHLAAKSGDNQKYQSIIRYLIDKGGNLESRDNQGRTPLLLARENNTTFLIGLNANRHAIDNSGKTLLHHAVAQGNLNQVRLLLTHGLSPHARDNDHKTPLLLLPTSLRDEISFDEASTIRSIARVLVNHGAEINAVDRNGKTLLHNFAESHSPNSFMAVDFLIDLGAQTNVQEHVFYQTPLHIASSRHAPVRFVSRLLQAGADQRVRDLCRRTPRELSIDSYYQSQSEGQKADSLEKIRELERYDRTEVPFLATNMPVLLPIPDMPVLTSKSNNIDKKLAVGTALGLLGLYVFKNVNKKKDDKKAGDVKAIVVLGHKKPQ